MIFDAATAYLNRAEFDAQAVWTSYWQVSYVDGFGPYAGVERDFAAPLPLALLINSPNLGEDAGKMLLQLLAARSVNNIGDGFAAPITIDSTTAGSSSISTGERERGWTFLHWACDMMCHDLVPTLLAHGLDSDCRDAAGRTPVDIAAATSHRRHVTAFAALQARRAAQQALTGRARAPGGIR